MTEGDNTRPERADAGLAERLSDEADLCRNDGANDIAELLDEAVAAMLGWPEVFAPNGFYTMARATRETLTVADGAAARTPSPEKADDLSTATPEPGACPTCHGENYIGGEEFPSNCPDKWHHPEPSDAAIEAWVMDNPKQIPPFISVPSFDDRAEERAVINGRLFLRADFAAFHRQKAEAAAAEKAEIERLRHIVKWAADDFETFSKVYGVLTDSDRSHFSKCSAKFRAALASSEQG